MVYIELPFFIPLERDRFDSLVRSTYFFLLPVLLWWGQRYGAKREMWSPIIYSVLERKEITYLVSLFFLLSSISLVSNSLPFPSLQDFSLFYASSPVTALQTRSSA
ncbi:hypothetical protein BJ875DRAFT_94135 [Amylocarpus encephaloides]|uniref:Uncharacterized protein n=1 Tax=Amylocarpus encephaloides TaxID=45428 RepID=A0A9P8C3H6_9HELO|nr:hypothetical protein BJ875DRAFT_94135 [Amylocarpus encephaloides]